MQKCKNLSKCLNGNFKCKLLKQQITLTQCKNCLQFIVERNKGIKKVSSKREFVKKETYQKVFERDKGKCRLCGTTKELQLHHIKYRSEKKDLINEPSNLIMLCSEHHRLVHSNKHYWQPKLIEMIGENK